MFLTLVEPALFWCDKYQGVEEGVGGDGETSLWSLPILIWGGGGVIITSDQKDSICTH